MNTDDMRDGTTPAREGYVLTGSGMEVYDVKGHIQRAFEGVDVGTYLRPREIQMRGRRDHIPASRALLLDVVKVRMKSALHHESIQGIVVDYDSNGKLIAYRKGEITVSPGAINNPTVECCDRDAADCDCPPLRQEYVKVRDAIGPDRFAEIEDRARNLANEIIVLGGFDDGDSDMLGDETGNTVKMHLVLAFMRQPEMMDHHEEAMMTGPDWKHKDNTDENLYSEGVRPGEVRGL